MFWGSARFRRPKWRTHLVDDQIRSLQEYVYLKYVDGARVDDIDEVAACQQLEAFFSQPANASDSECVYAGILYFELGYELEEKQVEYFRRAKYWLERHRALTGESWDAVDDRLEDVNAFFEDEGIEVEDTPLPEQVTLAPVLVEEISDHGTMMLVPAGSFLFGESREPVSVSAFYIDKYPVTNREYEAFCRATGYRFPKYWSKKRFNDPDAPVVGVSIADAQKYSRWVGKQLPTEEQWEKAFRGVDGRPYPWGEDEASDELACFGRDPAEGKTDPVTSHPKGTSPYGVCDLAGNVWEWTSTAVPDDDDAHVIKGGCYNDPSALLQAHVRLEAAPKDKFETIGFRCIKSA
jgi:sulfatase modifying factor 1